jgi:hypothetical protein
MSLLGSNVATLVVRLKGYMVFSVLAVGQKIVKRGKGKALPASLDVLTLFECGDLSVEIERVHGV